MALPKRVAGIASCRTEREAKWWSVAMATASAKACLSTARAVKRNMAALHGVGQLNNSRPRNTFRAYDFLGDAPQDSAGEKHNEWCRL